MIHTNPRTILHASSAALTLAASRRLPAGLVGVRGQGDPAAVLRELNAAFGDFRSRNDSRLDSIEASVSDLAQRISAGALNGGAPIGVTASNRSAVLALGGFARGRVEAAAHSESGPDGGFVIQDELASTIYSLQRNESAMRRLARVVPTRTGTYRQVVNRNGTASGWVGERESRPETKAMDLAELSFPAGEIYANPAISQRLLDDAEYDLGVWLLEEISREFSDREGAAFVKGDGREKPKGFLDYPTYETGTPSVYGKLEFVKSGAASTFATSNPWHAFVDALQALKARHRRNATWLMNSKTQGLVSKWVDAQGLPLWQRAIAMGQPDMFLGRPVELDENMPDVGAGAFPVAIGNWQDGYLISDRMGARLIRDALTNKGNVLFYTTKRVGGGVLDFEAIKLIKIAA